MYNFNLCGVCGKEMRFRHSSAKFCFPCADKRSKFNGGSRASYLVNKAIKEGLIKPVKEFLCIDCGAQATCYDHRDYNKPLEVDPVCSKCNKRRGPAIYLKTEEK